MEKQIKCIVFLNKEVVISEIEEVGSELGEPDCRIIKPFSVKTEEITSHVTLESWLSDYTKQNEFMIHSDKILTILDPKPTLLEKYLELTA